MATTKQIDANRRNARKSTDPRTAAGKAKARMNASKHRLTADYVALANESPDEF
jgi:hypothetical protein